MLIGERIESPEEELKRADHLVFVSLKYTRTCDVMKNAIKRMIAAFELAFHEHLELQREKKKIEEVPASAKERAILTKDLLGPTARKYFGLYNHLKKIDKADFQAFEEFRKNVTLKTKTSPPISVKMPDLVHYLELTKEFLTYLKQHQK
ncbi:MAG: hypothetical protein WC595_00680 [Candidatus Nanoarchaeia archaeon]